MKQLCVIIKTHRIQRCTSSHPLMTKPPCIVALPVEGRVSAPHLPDWWPTHLNVHHPNFTPLPYFLKYYWRYCSNVFMVNIKLQNEIMLQDGFTFILLFLVFCILKSQSRIIATLKQINLLLFPLEIIQKPYAFWWFQGEYKLTNLLKFA